MKRDKYKGKTIYESPLDRILNSETLDNWLGKDVIYINDVPMKKGKNNDKRTKRT